MSRISSKLEMYSLQQRGLLGNYLKTMSWAEFLRDSPSGIFGVRHRRLTGWPHFRRNMRTDELFYYVSRLIDDHKIEPADVSISLDTTLMDDCRTLQGEVCRSIPWSGGCGLTFAHSGQLACDTNFTCREEMRQPSGVVEHYGVAADHLLRRFMDAPSYDWLQHLMTEYPDAVVEMTMFSRSVGEFGWNTIFWECRDY